MRHRLHFGERMGQEFGMGSIVRFFGGVVLAAFIVIVTLARLAIEVVGASTTPDDFALLKQRMPAMLSWLFSTPWWVPTALLFGASGAAAWLIWSGTKRAAKHEMQEHDALDEKAIAAMIESRLTQLPPPERQTDLATHADLHAHDVKLVELSDRIKFLSDLVEGGHGQQELQFQNVEGRLGEIAKGCFDLEQKMNAWTRQHTDAQESRFENIDLGFAAIYNQEWHERLFRDLGEAYDRLAVPIKAGAGISDADDWQREVKSWRARLHQWLGIVEYYAMRAEEKILKVPDFVYERPWPFDETHLTANQVRLYKEMSAIWQSAQDEKPRIDKCFEMAAFHSPSKKGRLDSPPRPSEDR